MKVKVISVFRDKFTGKYYTPGEDWFGFIGFDSGWCDGVCCFHIAIAMIYSDDFCVFEFSHKKYLRFRID